jgi:HlyD family secretion protein
MDRRLRNRILIFLLLAAAIAFGLVKLIGRQPVTKITAVLPIRRNVVASISSNGKVEPISPFVVRAQLDTFVEAVKVVEGQTVKKGQLLIELNVREVAAQLAEARSKLLRAEEDLRVARAGGKADLAQQSANNLANAIAQRDRLQKVHDSVQRLIAKQAATKEELAANELELAKAQAQVTQLTTAKAEFDRAAKLDASRATLDVDQLRDQIAGFETKVRNGRITAPTDGTLYALGRNSESSQPIKAGDYVKVGDLLAEVANLHKVRVRVFVDEPELGGLHPGEPVKITWDALPGRVWTGETEIIPKEVVARGARSVGELLCAVSNDKLELLPNINVDVRIHSQERDNVLSVPRGTVQGDVGHWFVFVVRRPKSLGAKATLERRPIQVGIADAANYEVIGGLQENDWVATPTDGEFADGMVVRVMNAEALANRGRQDAH